MREDRIRKKGIFLVIINELIFSYAKVALKGLSPLQLDVFFFAKVHFGLIFFQLLLQVDEPSVIHIKIARGRLSRLLLESTSKQDL